MFSNSFQAHPASEPRTHSLDFGESLFQQMLASAPFAKAVGRSPVCLAIANFCQFDLPWRKRTLFLTGNLAEDIARLQQGCGGPVCSRSNRKRRKDFQLTGFNAYLRALCKQPFGVRGLQRCSWASSFTCQAVPLLGKLCSISVNRTLSP